MCHVTGNGRYNLITVNGDSQQAHLDHGDGVPGGDVPGMASFIFDSNCTPVQAPVACPCAQAFEQVVAAFRNLNDPAYDAIRENFILRPPTGFLSLSLTD